MLTECSLKLSYDNSNHHKCPLTCHSAFHFTEFGLFWRVLDFFQNNHFLLNNQFFPKNDFFEKICIMWPNDDLKVGSNWLADQELFLS